ncbi:unnamed protein product, partial [Amoebophrya sp. A25]
FENVVKEDIRKGKIRLARGVDASFLDVTDVSEAWRKDVGGKEKQESGKDSTRGATSSSTATLLSDALYYKWRVFSLCQGDRKTGWRTEGFKICRGGVVYIPPKVPDEFT